MGWTIQLEHVAADDAYDNALSVFDEKYPEATERMKSQLGAGRAAVDGLAWDAFRDSADAKFNITLSGHDSSKDDPENRVDDFVSVIVTKLPDAAEAESAPDAEESESRGPGIEGEGQDVRSLPDPEKETATA